ncbi:hypothetical protein GCM10028864_63610 [Microlunatus parietis]|nr:hypothetical protein [Microlunatus parietis]
MQLTGRNEFGELPGQSFSSHGEPAGQGLVIKTARPLERRFDGGRANERPGQRAVEVDGEFGSARIGDRIHRALWSASVLFGANRLHQPFRLHSVQHPVQRTDLDSAPGLDASHLCGPANLVTMQGTVGQQAEDQQPNWIGISHKTSLMRLLGPGQDLR